MNPVDARARAWARHARARAAAGRCARDMWATRALTHVLTATTAHHHPHQNQSLLHTLNRATHLQSISQSINTPSINQSINTPSINQSTRLDKRVDGHDCEVRLRLCVIDEVQVDELLELKVIGLHLCVCVCVRVCACVYLMRYRQTSFLSSRSSVCICVCACVFACVRVRN